MNQPAARHVVVEGIVQGVGFRPFVHGLATRHGLAGWVRNIGSGVEAIVEGRDAEIDAFLAALVKSPPPLAQITGLRVATEAAAGFRGFAIIASERSRGTQPIPADVALCDDCRRELYDPRDRRYRYAFINCTNCGPRYSIIEALPYDREHTTMRGFEMCSSCRAEYEDSASRRFHAEPIACPACGPRITLAEKDRRMFAEDALRRTRMLLAAGNVVAVKGLGGYHLVCDARSDDAVARIRSWKERGAKPFAVMVRDETWLAQLAEVHHAERALLRSAAHPIVLVRARENNGISPLVNPGVETIGVMLPYTPLHLLLIDDSSEAGVPPVLVMTSANRFAEPMIASDELALERLSTVADGVLFHDRPIATRVDDSVSHVIDGIEAPLRRARGYAPLPLRFPFAAPPILACGADMKSTFCLASRDRAMLSPYVGDLENYDVYVEFGAMIERLSRLLQVEPKIICHDLHPDYFSWRWAQQRYRDQDRIAVQHHHAHVASCMAEHGLNGPIIGVAFDGTGYGEDGCIWGGEFLVADYASFERAAHFDYVPMYGGELAIREPWRMALAYLRASGIAWDRFVPPRAIPEGLPAPLTSSAGRLFDAVAALIGIRRIVSYDGQAAIELEDLAEPAQHEPYDVVIRGASPARIDVRPMIAAIVDGLDRGATKPLIAARFHATIAEIVSRVCSALRNERGIEMVALTGGVFQNRRLSHDVAETLGRAGFQVFRHRRVPANDGGIAYGQAAVAAARFAAGFMGSEGSRSQCV